MKAFSIFRPGNHTSSAGQALTFTEDDLSASIAAYNPELHEAPITVGHPKHNHPAYGWVSKLGIRDGVMEAEPHQLDPQFEEMVEAKRYKKRSASFYAPDSPSNPVPGVYYLRHVAFLGAQPPAVKGLREVEFTEQEEGVVEFTDAYIMGALAQAFRSLREFFIDEYDGEKADTIVPNYLIQDLEAEARAPLPSQQVEPESTFNEPDEETTMTPEEIQAMQDENTALKAKATELDTKEASFAEREAALAAEEQAQRLVGIAAAVDAKIAAGKVIPAQRQNMIDFMASLDDTNEIEFAEGDEKKKLTQRKFMDQMLETMPKAIEFDEVGAGGSGDQNEGAEDIARKAVAFKEAEAKRGSVISVTEAVAAVKAGKAD